MKLIILNKDKPDMEFLEKYGEIPRIYRNTLIFLCKDEEQKRSFYEFIRKYLALKSIENDKSLSLTETQKREVKNKLKDFEQREYDEFRKFYRKLYLPNKNGFKEIDLGIATYGESFLDKEIYQFLKTQGEILEKIAPIVIKDGYLSEKDYVFVKNLYESLLRTPGELRIVSKNKFIESLKEGVKTGLFGFGYLINEKIECKEINKIPETITLAEEEVIIKPELCKQELGREKEEIKEFIKEFETKGEALKIEHVVKKPLEEVKERPYMDSLNLSLDVPYGKLSDLARVTRFLKERFEKIEVKVHIHAEDGKIDLNEYEDKILEALKQAGIKIIEKN